MEYTKEMEGLRLFLTAFRGAQHLAEVFEKADQAQGLLAEHGTRLATLKQEIAQAEATAPGLRQHVEDLRREVAELERRRDDLKLEMAALHDKFKPKAA